MATIKKSVVAKSQKETGTQITCLICKTTKPSSECRRVKTEICHKDYGACHKCASEIVEEQKQQGLRFLCELLNLPYFEASYETALAFHEDTWVTYTKPFYSGPNAIKRFVDSDFFQEETKTATGKKKKKKYKKLEFEDLDMDEMVYRWGIDTPEEDYLPLQTHFVKLKGHEAATEEDEEELVGMARTYVMIDEAFRDRRVKDIVEAQRVLSAQKKLRAERIKERGDNSLTSLGVAAQLLEHDRPINLQPGRYTDEQVIKYFKRFFIHHIKTMLGIVKRNEVELLDGEDEDIFDMEKSF